MAFPLDVQMTSVESSLKLESNLTVPRGFEPECSFMIYQSRWFLAWESYFQTSLPSLKFHRTSGTRIQKSRINSKITIYGPPQFSTWNLLFNQVCGSSSVTESWFLDDSLLLHFSVSTRTLWREKADVSTANIFQSKQLTPKKSIWLQSNKGFPRSFQLHSLLVISRWI